MKNNFIAFFLIILFILISSFFIFQNTVLAVIPAPTVSFTGDDLNQNGGLDDSYDSLIVIDINTIQPQFNDYELQYSTNNGQDWTDITANYDDLGDNHRKYYWSTSVINYILDLMFRARSTHNSGPSEYATAEFAIVHQQTNHGAHFFVEHFVTNDYNDNILPAPQTDANWDISRGLIEARYQGRYRDSDAYSTDLLDGVSNNNVLSVSFQPIQSDFDQAISYWVSNNGTDVAGPYSFAGQTVPTAQNVVFTSIGDKLYWRAQMDVTASQATPQLYQLRFSWTENYAPQACFIVNPTSDLIDPEREFVFNANCSGDLEDTLVELDFRWDWNSDGIFDTPWVTGGYSRSNIFNSTSTSNITLEVMDTMGVVDSYQSSINTESLAGDIFGWMWSAINDSTTGYGWTSLHCDNIYYETSLNLCGGSNYGLKMDEQNIWGWVWNPYIGWLCLGNTCDAYSPAPTVPTNPYAVYSRATGEVNGWGKFIDRGELGWLQLRPSSWCGSGVYDCTNLNLSNRTLAGFAWAGGYNESYPAEIIGPGWQQFGGYINVPWLETHYGSVYGKGDVGSNLTIAPPAGSYSAHYCILAGGEITNFTSGQDCAEINYNQYDFPDIGNQYKNILGIINFNDILDGDETVISGYDVDASMPTILSGKVYHFTGYEYYTIDQPFIIYNARNLDSSGAGTIVIDGDLYIDADFYYEDVNTTAKIENLASVAWIVKGDVIIDPAVTNIVGAFIVLGDGSTACPIAGCGKFSTGDDSADNNQLTISGLIMAKQMEFQRYYKVNTLPAEKIFYDGRVLVNTPPGLEDVASGLPVWREAFATTQIEQ